MSLVTESYKYSNTFTNICSSYLFVVVMHLLLLGKCLGMKLIVLFSKVAVFFSPKQVFEIIAFAYRTLLKFLLTQQC